MYSNIQDTNCEWDNTTKGGPLLTLGIFCRNFKRANSRVKSGWGEHEFQIIETKNSIKLRYCRLRIMSCTVSNASSEYSQNRATCASQVHAYTLLAPINRLPVFYNGLIFACIKHLD